MASQDAISSTLNSSDRDATTKVLQDSLVDLVDLHLAAKQAHWNVVGKQFRSVHLQLDELVTAARGFADDVAERSATLGDPPDGRAETVAKESGVPKLEAGWKYDKDIVAFIVEALDKLIRRLRERVEETDKTDQVTQDLLITITSKLEEAHWMWQAQGIDS